MFPRDHRLIDDLQIGDIYLGAKDSHLYEKISFRIWKRTYGSGQIEAEHFYSLAEFEITWFMLFFRFFRVKLHTGSGLFDLLAESFALAFHLCGRDIFFPKLAEVLHSLVSNFFCLAENRVCFFVRFIDNTLFALVKAFLFLL